jgi:two-component system, chemotaxis family, CheB/CheR fusion protein
MRGVTIGGLYGSRAEKDGGNHGVTIQNERRISKNKFCKTVKAKSKQIEKGKTDKQIRVVGIGASAGGLEALQEFFKNVSEKSGLAYIVVQHLSPDYKSMMDELLARQTSMPIIVIEDGMRVEVNTVYLIPPRMNLRIFEDQLFLTKQDPKKGLNLPIDIFFRSLAEEKGKDAIGIILSGTGSDGTMGCRAIKEVNGMLMVQDERTAKFNGMPASAISTGLIDYILSPEKMGQELSDYLKHPLIRQTDKDKKSSLKGVDALSKVVLILRDYTGIDFSYYKENTINRRLERRISINRLSNLEEYIPFLEASDKEKETLYREFLIGVTQFFRDKEAFSSLREKVLPELFTENKKLIRVWTTGCSTGEEAYSIAILLMEVAEQLNFRGDIKVFASDIDRRAIEIAGKGYYPDSIVADVDPVLLAKYFRKKEDGYQINEDIRNNIVFATHNVLKDPPFSKLDMVVCRNLFIYLKPEIQGNLLSRFYYSLSPGGFLFMGSSETLGGMSDAFDVIDLKNKIYRYKKGFVPPIIDSISIDLQANRLSATNRNGGGRRRSGSEPDDLLNDLLSEFVPPSVIIDSNYFIVNIINNINPFTEIQVGSYSKELFSILPKDLGLFVNNFLRQLKSGKKTFLTRNISGLESLGRRTVKVDARVITKNSFTFYMLSFDFLDESKVEPAEKSAEETDFNYEQGTRFVEMEKELKTAKENLAATIEELESANEELQSSNEELIASNEELQSTNEELQSVNEELYTVNSEHQQKIEELTRLNNDINNLLKNTEIAAIYLDSKLCIRKITPQVTKVTNILENDVGRPVTHLSVMDSYPDLSEDVSKVMESLQPIDKELKDRQNRPFFVRLRPYRTANNAVDGVLITLIDISELKKLKKEVHQKDERLSAALQMGNTSWWEWNVETGKVVYDDRKATMLGYTPKEFPDDVYAICDFIHPDDYEQTMEEMRKVLDGKRSRWDVEYRMRRMDGSYAWYKDHGSVKERSEDGKVTKMIGTVVNVSELHEKERELHYNTELMNLIFEHTPVSTTMVNSEGWITFANKRAEKLFNITSEQITERSYDASEWKITDEKGKSLDPEKLPFSIIKHTKKPINGFKHYIEIPPKKRILLSIDGAPVLSPAGKFEGAVFTIKSEGHG